MLRAGRENGASFAVVKFGMAGTLAASLLLCAIPSIASSQAAWNRVSSFEYGWQEGGAVATFLVDVPAAWEGSGDFARLRIVMQDGRNFTFKNADGWVKCSSDSAALPRTVLQSNLVRTDYVLFLRAAGHDRVLAFLFGRAYASSPGSIDVIELNVDGDPKLILHKDELGLRAVEDLNGDGTAEIIAYPCLSQTWGNGLLTYDPYNIYSLSSTKGGKANLSLGLSKTYNLRHYYGWAGPNCREDVAVVLHPPGGGKAQIMARAEAERLSDGVHRRARK